jgi:hypothetical protein
LPALAFGLYLLFGEPAALDANRAAATLASTDASATTFERDALLRHLDRQPRDGRGWALLARMDFEADRLPTRRLAKGGRQLGPGGSDPAIWCEYADALGRRAARSPAAAGVRHARPHARPRTSEGAGDGGSAAYEQRVAMAVRHGGGCLRSCRALRRQRVRDSDCARRAQVAASARHEASRRIRTRMTDVDVAS